MSSLLEDLNAKSFDPRHPEGPKNCILLKERSPIPGGWFAKRGEDRMSIMLKRDKSRYFIIDPAPVSRIWYFTGSDIQGIPAGECKGFIDIKGIMRIDVEERYGQEITITTSAFSGSKPRDWILMSPDKLQAAHWVKTINSVMDGTLVKDEGKQEQEDEAPIDRGETSTNETGGIEVAASPSYLDPDDAVSDEDDGGTLLGPGLSDPGYLAVGEPQSGGDSGGSNPFFGQDPGYLDVGDEPPAGTTSVEVIQIVMHIGPGESPGIVFAGGSDEELRLHVDTVQPDTAAEAEGIRRGDVLMLLNGKSVTDMGCALAQSMLDQAAGGEITMTLKRGATAEDMKN